MLKTGNKITARFILGLGIVSLVAAGLSLGLNHNVAQAAVRNVPVVVAVLDTGLDREHPVFSGKMAGGINFSDSPTTNDVNGHGTHVAGIIAASSANVALLNVKVADDTGVTRPETMAKGITWAADNGAGIINLSLTVARPDRDLERAIAYALAKGCIIVAAAGNGFLAEPSFPAAYPGVIAVGATDERGHVTAWSNGALKVTVTAPGVQIVSSLPGAKYGPVSGTSQAAAAVSARMANEIGQAVSL